MRQQKRVTAAEQLAVQRFAQLACAQARPVGGQQGLRQVGVAQQHLAVLVDQQGPYKKSVCRAQAGGIIRFRKVLIRAI